MEKLEPVKKHQVDKLINDAFLPTLNKLIEQVIDRQKMVLKFIENTELEKGDVKPERCKIHTQNAIELIEDVKLEFITGYDVFFKDYNLRVSDFYGQLDKVVILNQELSCFDFVTGDSSKIRIYKLIKRSFFKLHQLVARMISPSQVIWRHKIPLRDVSRTYFRIFLPLSLMPLYEEVLRWVTKSQYIFWHAIFQNSTCFKNQDKDIDEIVDTIHSRDFIGALHHLEENAQQLREGIKKAAEKRVVENYKGFQRAMEKSGTLEMPNRNFSSKAMYKNLINLDQTFAEISRGWNSSLSVLYDQWRLNLTLSENYFEINFHLDQLKEKLHENINSTIKPQIKDALSFYNKLKKTINLFNGDKQTLFFNLKNHVKDIEKQYSDFFIQGVKDVMQEGRIVKDFDLFEQSINQYVKVLRSEFISAGDFNYNTPINEDHLQILKIDQLISDIYQRELIPELNKIKSSLISTTQEFIVTLEDVGHKASFNLLSITDSNIIDNGLSVNELIEKIDDQLICSTDWIQQIYQKYSEAILEQYARLRGVILRIVAEVYSLKSPSIALEKQNILIKRKNQPEGFAEPTPEKYLKKIIKEFRYKIKTGTKNLGKFIDKSLKGRISGEIKINTLDNLSDFIKSIEKQIHDLPYLYRRLYKLQPINEELHLFVGRNRSTNQIFESYQRWMSGSSENVLIIGDRSSGITSMVNYFLNHNSLNIRIITLNINKRINSTEDLIQTLASQMLLTGINEFDDLVSSLNKEGIRKIVVIENLHLFFNKSRRGFDPLIKLLEVISRTTGNIFWICSIQSVTFDFLSKVISIQEYFNNKVIPGNMSLDDIQQLIRVRHRISGFQIRYATKIIPDERGRRNRKDLQNQTFIRDSYFKHLSKLSGGNPAIAMRYWLASVSVEDKDQLLVNLGDLPHPPLSIHLKLQDRLILISLILHGQLNEREIAELIREPLEEVKIRLLILEQKRIIFYENNDYEINILAYQTIHNTLTNLQLITKY